MLKFKSWKGRDKWLFFLTIGVILCILAFPVESLTQKSRGVSGNAGAAGMEEMTSDRGNGLAGKNRKDPAGDDGNSLARDDGNSLGGDNGNTSAAFAGDSGTDGTESALEAAARVSNSYEAELEQRVREILKNVDGVGKVDVMIVLKSSSQKVVHTDNSFSRSVTDEKDSTGGTRKIENEENDSTTVFTSGDGQSTPIIEKELRPELSGIIISASGGGNPTVRAEISAAMEALFDLPAHKIKVLKRVE